MNWNAIGAIGQILGSLATFVTVVFLAVQVHDSESETRRAIAQARSERSMQMLLVQATNEQLVSIENKVMNAVTDRTLPSYSNAVMKQAGLNQDEAFMLYTWHLARWNTIAEMIIHLDELLPVDRAQFEVNVRISLSNASFVYWYGFSKPTLNPAAVRYIDNLLAQPGRFPNAPDSSTVSPSKQETMV